MFFTDPLFLLYLLPAALAVYWSLPAQAQNPFLLVVSLVFYAWGEPVFLVPMALLVVVNHVSGSMIAASGDAKYRRKILRHAVVLSVMVLLATLYGPELADAFFRTLGLPAPGLELPAPLGVSFFTLQGLTYVFEIARGKAPAERSIISTGLFIAFLPTVVAGPVLRYTDLAGQLRERTMTPALLGLGCERLVMGLAKLLILATPLAAMATTVFERSAAGNQFNTTPVSLAWLGVLAFGLSYYLTLSGISDTAIGLARLFGFALKENFRHPYAAHTVAGFWNRWHISMYRWFFVYVFLALGGRRSRLVRIHGALRPRNFVLRNSLVLWVLVGLWHGVSWSNLFFGLWFFVFTFFEWVVSLQRKPTRSPLWSVYVLLVVGIGWVFLRCRSFSESITYFSNLIGVNGNGLDSEFTLALLRENWLFIALGILASTPLARRLLERLGRRRRPATGYALAALHALALAAVAWLCFVFLGSAGATPPFLFR